ncbi:hypothetical protein [Emticicia sp. BO119]|uniref:hypothetical protein n=1 Tax=Emticicia sp. BO119 TaxID=2757768 RepID=UPI0015F0B97A|nr:hypothetical protein [Emticicia sp. BO119]MBA4849493.1 hypothetical protein [Emticicia sp. BO119]
MTANGNNDSINIPFVGGLIMSLIEPLKHLFIEPSTFMTFDIFKTIFLGFVGAIASGIGSLVWNKYLKKRFKP